jgi:hypothetical protein
MSEAISRQKQVPATGSHPTGRIREGDESVVADQSQVVHAEQHAANRGSGFLAKITSTAHASHV